MSYEFSLPVVIYIAWEIVSLASSATDIDSLILLLYMKAVEDGL